MVAKRVLHGDMRRLICCFATFLLLHLPAAAGTIEDIAARGVVTCAVEEKSPGLAELTGAMKSGPTRVGLAVDLCAALASAVLGNAAAVAFVTVTAADAHAALQAEEADVLLVAMPWRMAEEVEQGVMLVVPLLEAPADGRVFGPVVRQGDDAWFIALRWVVLALARETQMPLPQSTVQAGLSLGLHKSWNGMAAASLDDMLKQNAAGIDAQGFRPMVILPAASWR